MLNFDRRYMPDVFTVYVLLSATPEEINTKVNMPLPLPVPTPPTAEDKKRILGNLTVVACMTSMIRQVSSVRLYGRSLFFSSAPLWLQALLEVLLLQIVVKCVCVYVCVYVMLVCVFV